jgi:monoamine oxidase
MKNIRVDMVTPSSSRSSNDVVDIAIVGGGLSGLGCAYHAARLLAAAKQAAGSDSDGGCFRIAILEGRDRVGGRTLTAEYDGMAVIDLGGQWIGPSQHRMMQLAQDLQLELIPQHWWGQNDIQDAKSDCGDVAVRVESLNSGSGSALVASEALELASLTSLVEDMAATVVGPPAWKSASCPLAVEWDQMR